MDTNDTGHDRCPSQLPDPTGVGNATSRRQRKNKKSPFWFQEGVQNFLESSWRLPLQPSPYKNGRGGRRISDYTFDPWIASITASVTSFVVALPPTSGVSTPAAHTFSTAAINRTAASFSPRCSSI
jgi:hypothetical protein